MARQGQHRGLFRRYAILLFSVIMLVALGITLLLTDFASDQFVAYELDTVQTSMDSAASDLETQYLLMRDVAHRIRSTYAYRPGILRSDATRELEVLKDFVRYANYSPLIHSYFLMYQGDQKIYTSEGRASYFPYYAGVTFQSDLQEADALFQTLNQVERETVLTLGTQRLLLFPIRFTNVQDTASNALLCFLLTPEQLENRMRSVGPRLPEETALYLGEDCVWTAFDEAAAGSPGVYALSAASEKGIVTLRGRVNIARLPLLLSSVPPWLYVGIVLAFLVTSVLAMLLAHAAVRPLQQLIRKYAAPTDQLQNEFEQLDQLVARIEEENQHSARVLRDRTLMTILRGYYSERVVDRLGLTELSFDKAQYCAAVIQSSALPAAQIEPLLARLEGCGGAQTRVYAVHLPSDHLIAIILGFDSGEAKEESIRRMTQLLQERAALFVGEACTTPHRLSASYVDALTAYQRGQDQEVIDVHSYILRLVAACETDHQSLQDQLQQQLQSQYALAAPTLVKKFAAEAVGELNTLAAQKNVALDNERLSALVTLPSMELLLKDLHEVAAQAFRREVSPAAARANQTAMAIVAYIQEHSADPDLSLGDISAHFSFSNDYISTLVKEVTGMAFKEYLTDLRMRRACTLLVERRDMTITEISEAVGYRKPSNFIRKFKELYGVTPTQYR